MHTTFINNQNTKAFLSELLSDNNNSIFSNYEKLGEVCYLYEQKTKEISLTETNTYQFFINHLNPKLVNNSIEAAFYKLLLRTMYQVEMKSGHSSHFVFLYARSLLKSLLKISDELSVLNEQELLNDFEMLWIKELKPLLESCSVPYGKSHYYNKKIDNADNNNVLIDNVLHEALTLAGAEGKIFIEKGKQNNFVIEMKSGYSFNSVEPFTFLLDNHTNWFRNYPKVLVIDGLIEEVSEIDNVLNKAHETQQCLVIIALGFSEEVAATIKTNNDQNKFDVQLLKFKNDIQVLNSINDVSVVCGGQPVSSMMGQTVSMIDWNDIPTIDKIQIKPNQTNIENKKTEHNVLVHMKSILQKKRDSINSDIEDIQDIYDLRLKSLAANSVYIYLPDISDVEINSLKVKFDNLLRNHKSIMQFGMLNTKAFTDKLSSITETMPHRKALTLALKETLEQMAIKKPNDSEASLLTIALGFLFVSRLCLMLISSNGFVVLD